MNKGKVIEQFVPVERTIIGTDADLTRLLRHQAALGRLLTPVHRLEPIRLRDGKWQLVVTLAVPLPSVSPLRAWWLRHGRTATLVATILVVAGALLALGAFAVQAVIRTVAGLASGGLGALLVTVLLLWTAMSIKRRHPCKGLHCGGCKGRH
jgi:hypothetical protein